MAALPFRDNVVILTGASMGMGAQLAYQLANQGAQLVLAARSADRLEDVAAVCRTRGGRAVAVPADQTDETQGKWLVGRTVEHVGRVDTLLYNAGRGYPKRFDDMPDLSDLKSEITLNYLGLVSCVYDALPHLKRSRGRIVGVSSFGSLVGLPGTAGYNSSTHAMRGFLTTLRAELIGTGVTVTIVFPGAVRTDRLRETMGHTIDRVSTMSPQRCAARTIRAAARRRRQLVMTLEGTLLVGLYQIRSRRAC